MAVLYRDAADPPAPAEYVVTATKASPDTLLESGSSAWRDAAAISWGPARWRTRFSALWSPAVLSVRFDCLDEAPWWTMTGRDDPIWQEEVVELFIDPAGSGRDYAEIEISPANVVCDLRVGEPWPALDADTSWHLDGLETRVARWTPEGAGGGWSAIAILPWNGFRSLCDAAAARVPPNTGDRWRFNVFRIKRPGGAADPERGAVYAAWSVPEGPSFHVPAVFRDLVFRGHTDEIRLPPRT